MLAYPCELCGEPVRIVSLSPPDPKGDMVILCEKCISDSRKVDGTLNSAFNQIKIKRGMV